MTEKTQKDLLEELESSTLTEILDLLICYKNAPAERTFVKEFILNNFGEKPHRKYLKSLKNMPKSYSADTIKKIEHARTVARDIIEHMDFESINNLNNIKAIISQEMRKRV